MTKPPRLLRRLGTLLIPLLVGMAIVAPGRGGGAAAAAPGNPPAAKTPAAAAAVKADERPDIEVCFVLDTTGSMGALIDGARKKIWSIANEFVKARPTPRLKVALVLYRDRGDAYVTRVHGLTEDMDAIYAKLQECRAEGGGDGPESVNEAIAAAIRELNWSTGSKTVKTIFLVGDAPPHMDYANGPKYPELCEEAVRKNLVIHTIQCGADRATAVTWREIAAKSEGQYAAIEQSGGMMVHATPYDLELKRVNAEIGRTMIAYGNDLDRSQVLAKQAAAESAPASVLADRLAFNSTVGRTVQGGGELLDSIASGTLKPTAIERSKLPAELRSLEGEKLEEHIRTQQARRQELKQKADELNRQRNAFIASEAKKAGALSTNASFDAKVNAMVREQAKKAGLSLGH